MPCFSTYILVVAFRLFFCSLSVCVDIYFLSASKTRLFSSSAVSIRDVDCGAVGDFKIPCTGNNKVISSCLVIVILTRCLEAHMNHGYLFVSVFHTERSTENLCRYQRSLYSQIDFSISVAVSFRRNCCRNPVRTLLDLDLRYDHSEISRKWSIPYLCRNQCPASPRSRVDFCVLSNHYHWNSTTMETLCRKEVP